MTAYSVYWADTNEWILTAPIGIITQVFGLYMTMSDWANLEHDQQLVIERNGRTWNVACLDAIVIRDPITMP